MTRRPPRAILRVVLWGGAACFLGFLAIRDVQLDRMIEVVADIPGNRNTAYLTSVGPPPRIDTTQEELRLIGEPVYVNLRIPRWFDRVVVEVEYDNPLNLPFRFGVRTHPEIWQFDVKTVEPGSDIRLTQHPDISMTDRGGIRIARIPFALQRRWQVERNVYRFIVALPSVSPESPFVIRSMRVIAERDPICLAGICL